MYLDSGIYIITSFIFGCLLAGRPEIIKGGGLVFLLVYFSPSFLAAARSETNQTARRKNNTAHKGRALQAVQTGVLIAHAGGLLGGGAEQQHCTSTAVAYRLVFGFSAACFLY